MNHNVDSMGVSQCTIFSLCQNGRGESETQGWEGWGGGGGGGWEGNKRELLRL